MRTGAESHPVGVALYKPHAILRHAEPFAGELREAGLMALAARHRADHDLDRALGLDGDDRALLRRAALRFDIAAEPDAAPPAARLRLRLASGEPVPIGQFEHRVEHRAVIAAVIGHA